METAMERLYARQVGRVGTTVTIQRGSLSTTLVPTVLGSQLLKIAGDEGTTQTVRTDKDFFILATDYLIDAEAVEPERHDRIVETIDGVTAVYEVLPYGDEKEFRWADEFRKVYRIHTKRVE
jgi:hypothetical protein